jgi:rod shape-determining protein MreC
MQQLIYFIKKFRYFLLFISLEILAVSFTIQFHSYHRSKFINSANFLSGGIYNKVNSIGEYMNLKSENLILNEENVRLKNLLEKKSIDTKESSTVFDSTRYFQKYEYSTAKIVNNNYTKRNNYLTIDKGSKQGLAPDLGVVNSKGIIGVTKNISSNYATVLSILNSNSMINIRLKNSSHIGTMIWDGRDYTVTQITDIVRQAVIKQGDTIITGGKSAIFPEGILIGTIKDFTLNNNQYEQINVQLFNDMSALGSVQIVNNLQKTEQLNLEQSSENE